MQLFVAAKGIVYRDDKILLLRESPKYLEGTEAGKWDVPGGRIEPEETLQEGLQREVREESGLDVSVGRVLGAYDGFPPIGGERAHVVRIYFLCEVTGGEVTLSNDHDAFDWIEPSDRDGKKLMDDIEKILIISQIFL